MFEYIRIEAGGTINTRTIGKLLTSQQGNHNLVDLTNAVIFLSTLQNANLLITCAPLIF